MKNQTQKNKTKHFGALTQCILLLLANIPTILIAQDPKSSLTETLTSALILSTLMALMITFVNLPPSKDFSEDPQLSKLFNVLFVLALMTALIGSVVMLALSPEFSKWEVFGYVMGIVALVFCSFIEFPSNP